MRTTTVNDTTPNGSTRKSLAVEIDRLQATVNTLADGLREAVRQETSRAVQEAVQGLLVEALTNPDIGTLLGNIHSTSAPNNSTAKKPGMMSRLRAWVMALPGKARAMLQSAWAHKTPLLAGLGAALATIMVCKVGPLLGAAAWLGSKLAVLFSRAALALRGV
jgi:hypothetical protein